MTLSPSDTQPVTHEITKGFVPAGGGLLHYVRQGQGPAVVLLHASPCSAKVMAPLQAAWSDAFTTFAFDLPGFGMSDLPEADEITIELLGDVIAEGMRNLGITQAALYGRHTGASVCLAVALQHPDLAAMLLTDGLPIFANPYSPERLKKYLAPIEPTGDGLYLPWTFIRYREQHMFWPWDAADIEHRSDADLPDAAFLHRGTVEMLEAADTYIPTYRAAFLYDTVSRIEGVACPAYYGNRPGDSQFKTIPLYPDWADVRVIPRDPAEAELAERELLQSRPASGSVPAWQSRFNGVDRMRDYIATRHGAVYAIGHGLTGTGLPTLFLHDMPGGIDLHRDNLAGIGEGGPVLGFDLGGNGNSDLAGTVDLETWLDQIDDVLDHMGWNSVVLCAQGLSGAVAAAYAARSAGRVSSLTLRSPALLNDADRAAFAAHPAPDISPEADGTHLMRLWQHLRDQELWFPWFDTSHTAIRKAPPRIAPRDLNARAVTILKQARHYAPIWDLLSSHDLPGTLDALSVPVTIATDPADVFAPLAERRGPSAAAWFPTLHPEFPHADHARRLHPARHSASAVGRGRQASGPAAEDDDRDLL